MIGPHFIRPWTHDDAPQLRPMILACIEETYAVGAAVKPTKSNMELLLMLGMQWAERGEPTLVCKVNGDAVAYTLWGSLAMPFGLELRDTPCFGMGTFVLPAYRRQGYSAAIRRVALDMAKTRGYGHVEGMAFHEGGIASVLPVGFRVTAVQVEAAL